ncbi:MAG: hypothetical protein ACPGOV_17195 [Magnetovibrionaceae bacterium]
MGEVIPFHRASKRKSEGPFYAPAPDRVIDPPPSLPGDAQQKQRGHGTQSASNRLDRALETIAEAGRTNRAALGQFRSEMDRLKKSTDALGASLKAYGSAMNKVDVEKLRETGRKLKEQAAQLPDLPSSGARTGDKRDR